VVRAAHLWFALAGGELTLEIKLQPGDSRLGFAISRLEPYHHVRRASKLPAGEMLPAGQPCMRG
jgi:hypothetical protein